MFPPHVFPTKRLLSAFPWVIIIPLCVLRKNLIDCVVGNDDIEKHKSAFLQKNADSRFCAKALVRNLVSGFF